MEQSIVANDQFALFIGAELTSVEAGRASARLTVDKRHLNGAGVCMGGVLFALADWAAAAAVNSHDILTLTTGANITFVSSAREGDVLTAEATEVANHHRLPYAEVRITNQEGKLIAAYSASGYRKGQTDSK